VPPAAVAPSPAVQALGTAEQADVAALDKLIADLDAVRVASQRSTRSASPSSVLAEPWPLFIRRMRCLTSQSWGPKAEAYLRHLHGWEKVSPSLGRGDVCQGTPVPPCHAEFYEMKVTMIVPTNPAANFVQIRPHHAVAGYQLFVVQPDFSLVHLYLTKEQMACELAEIGTLAHGTIAAGTKDDDRAEWAVRIAWDAGDAVRRRWRHYEVSAGAPDAVCCPADR
jgi:hypothetical protein